MASLSNVQFKALLEAYIAVQDARGESNVSDAVAACLLPNNVRGHEINQWRDEQRRPARGKLAGVTAEFERLLEPTGMDEEAFMDYVRQAAKSQGKK